MRIAIIVEGKTEKAFIPHLKSYLAVRHDCKLTIDCMRQDGRIPTHDKLRRVVTTLLSPVRDKRTM